MNTMSPAPMASLNCLPVNLKYRWRLLHSMRQTTRLETRFEMPGRSPMSMTEAIAMVMQKAMRGNIPTVLLRQSEMTIAAMAGNDSRLHMAVSL